MIARVTKGHGFAALARYLETGRDDANHSDRVVWSEARNLPTDDPHTASVLMRATAAQSTRTEKPVYHVALSFNPEDAVDRATMVQVADRLMNDLGLREHQALIVAHGDTRHPHVHLMINRVHPETSRAWHPGHDYARVERSLREQERELGFRAVSGRHYRLNGQERPDQSAGPTGEQSFDMRARQEASPRGHGAENRNAAEEAEPLRPAAPRSHNAPARAATDARADAVEPARDPSAERRPHQRGATEASRSVPDAPAARQAPDRAAPSHGDSRRNGTSALAPRLEAVRQTLIRLDGRIQLERSRDTTRDELDRAHMRLLPHTAQRAEARQASGRFRATLAEVYRDPVAARRAFHARAEQVGVPAAAAELARRPGRFGELHGTQVGPVRSAERTAALRSARKLETLGTEHIHRVHDAWAHRADYRRERATVVHLDRRLKTINHELDRTPRRNQLEQRLARQLRGLEAPHRRALQRSLPVPHQRLVAAATMIGREFAHEQGHER